MAKWHKGSISSKKIDVKLRLQQMYEDLGEIYQYVQKENESPQTSEIKVLIEGTRAVMDLLEDIKSKK
tara:strand:- start:132 stop:335 length:204 start_codon:yes stop_codon:yes gene_type:complete